MFLLVFSVIMSGLPNFSFFFFSGNFRLKLMAGFWVLTISEKSFDFPVSSLHLVTSQTTPSTCGITAATIIFIFDFIIIFIFLLVTSMAPSNDTAVTLTAFMVESVVVVAIASLIVIIPSLIVIILSIIVINPTFIHFTMVITVMVVMALPNGSLSVLATLVCLAYFFEAVT